MRALVLCAGLGTRLRPLTYFNPKVMIDIEGKPCLHYKSDKIMKHFGSDLLYFYEPKLLGEDKTLEIITSKFQFIKGDYLLVRNGDTLTNLNLPDFFKISQGKSIRHMDKVNKNIYAGTKILSPDYFLKGEKVLDCYLSNTWWVDIGTFQGLKKARKIYEKFGSMR